MNVLAELLSSRTRAEIIALFTMRPGERFYLREVARLTRADVHAVKQELDRLERMGLLASETSGNRRYIRANTRSSLFPELKNLVIKTLGLGDTLRAALKELGGIDFAFVYGSVAAMSEKPGSDLDLFIVGSVPGPALHKVLSKAKAALSREINTSRFTLQELQKRIQTHDSFITNIIKGKKVFLIGTEREFKNALGAGAA